MAYCLCDISCIFSGDLWQYDAMMLLLVERIEIIVGRIDRAGYHNVYKGIVEAHISFWE